MVEESRKAWESAIMILRQLQKIQKVKDQKCVFQGEKTYDYFLDEIKNMKDRILKIEDFDARERYKEEIDQINSEKIGGYFGS